ncbi:histone-like nucleoid-structuring protein Lsr2 [Streptomyces sp. NPDC051704]|uniref:Lsr2 family DNA-binding protein n=1 Tax=Streptomyces sp. NPDC051704 TaxID=3365671 RepID=UPI003797A59D
MTDLSALTRICPAPRAAMHIAWEHVESALGMALPTGYKQLAEHYGPGAFCDYIHVHHPHGPTEFVHLTGPVPARVRAYLRKDFDQGTHPVPYDPEQLFAIGATDNGERIFWITDPAREPDRWRIAVSEARGPHWFTFDGTLTDFLASVLSGQTEVPQFPRDLLAGGPSFTPAHPVLWKPEPIPHQAPVDTAALRAWARANDYDVPPRGRIPAEVREAWERHNS